LRDTHPVASASVGDFAPRQSWDNSTVDRWFMAGGARSTNQRELRASIDAGTRSDCCGHSALLEPLLQPRLQQGTRSIRRSAALTF
jgi:hypothetical protein